MFVRRVILLTIIIVYDSIIGMNTPHTPETKQEGIPPAYIQDVSLAWEVAHGEYPNTVAAIEAKRKGFDDESDRLMGLASVAGHVAGTAYIEELEKQSLWESLTPEQLETAEKTRAAMLAEFGRDEADFDLIGVVRTDDDGNETTSTELTLTEIMAFRWTATMGGGSVILRKKQ